MIETLKKRKLPVIIALIYIILAVVQPDKAKTALDNSVYYLVEMAQIMPVIFLLTVSIDVLIPKAWIMKHFGENSGIVGALLSLLLGSISAGPIYAAFPICKTLLKKGASVSNVVIILSAWAVVKIPMLANEAKFLGPQFMLVRWVLTVLMIFLMGFIMGKVIKKEELPNDSVIDGEPLTINEYYCIGCGVCVQLAPDFYEMNVNKAIVKEKKMVKDNKELLSKTAEKCPGNAISFNPKY